MNNFGKKIIVVFLIVLIVGGLVFYELKIQQPAKGIMTTTPQQPDQTVSNLLMIKVMREKKYPGSPITIEQTLLNGSNYKQYIVSYKSRSYSKSDLVAANDSAASLSDGLKIYALLTIPEGNKPKNGWPVIIFNHGYIPPAIYRTTERYVAYVDALAKNGFIVFKPDYRGNGNSQGQPEGAYYSPAYAIDVLNAVASMKKYPGADPNKIGMWGHSMGGNIALRDMVVNTKDIKVAVIWGGVVGSYNDLINNWQRRVTYQPPPSELALRNNGRAGLIRQYGTPTSNPSFWNSIDPTYFLKDISIPVQLHQGLADEEVPPFFSQNLYDKLKGLGKTVEYYTYPGADHNLSGNAFGPAMERTIAFFNKYLKS